MEVILVAPIDLTITKPGGTRSYVFNLGKELVKKEINTTILGFNKCDTEKDINKKDIKYISIAKDKNISSLGFLLRLMVCVPFLKIPPDSMIHVQNTENLLPFLIFKRKNPKIVTIHGRKNNMDFIILKGKLKGFVINIIEKALIPRFDKIIAINEETKDYYLSNYRNLNDKISVIPTGVNIDIFKEKVCISKNRYNTSKEIKTILYVGRFSNNKGLDILLQAFKILQNNNFTFQLVLVGDGPEKSNLKNIVKDLRLTNVLFIETVNNEEIPDIMNCSDVFALCSSGEGMPTVVLESLACGLPVVSTRVGDVHKVVLDGISGYLVNERAAEEIAEKLLLGLNNSAQLKKNCINIAREYSWENNVNKIISVYEEAIKRRNHFDPES